MQVGIGANSGQVQVLIIADDLTGALDTASPFAEKGLKVRVFTAPEAVPSFGLDCDVLSVTTNSRHCEQSEAAALAGSAARLAHMLKPKLVIKKIDSRLKGNVEAECRAVARELGLQGMCIVPAAPDVGRCVINGHVVGAGVPTPISVHAIFKDMRGVQIPDAQTNDDLALLADQHLKGEGVLAVCSRGLAIALANKLAGGTPERFIAKLPILIAIGSRDPVTRAQAECLQSACRCHVLDAPNGEIVDEAPRTECLLVRTTGDDPLATSVAERFAQNLRPLVVQRSPRTILLTGGDTAAAVLNLFNCQEIEVCGEAAPGLPWCRASLNGSIVQLISKSGGFGNEQTLVDLLGGTVKSARKED